MVSLYLRKTVTGCPDRPGTGDVSRFDQIWGSGKPAHLTSTPKPNPHLASLCRKLAPLLYFSASPELGEQEGCFYSEASKTLHSVETTSPLGEGPPRQHVTPQFSLSSSFQELGGGSCPLCDVRNEWSSDFLQLPGRGIKLLM